MRLFPLALVALLGTSCIQTYGPPPPYYGYPGNIYLAWTFNGAGCSQTPMVSQVMVSVANDPVPIVPNTFACQVGNPPPNQLVIYNYNPGSYLVSLSGLDASGNVIWFGGRTVVVNGNVSATIDLQPVATGTTFAYLSWNFATAVGSAFPPCTGLAEQNPDPDRIDSVALFVDGSNDVAQTYACSTGFGPGQVSTPFLSAGDHSLQLVAYQAGISYAFAQTEPVTVNFDANTPTSQTFTLNWLVGGVGAAWRYPNPNACSAAGIASVTATFSGAADAGYGVSGYPCQPDGGVAPFKHLPAVTTTGPGGVPYALTVDALGAPPSSPILFDGTLQNVTIQPGHFYDGTASTVVTVPLH